MGDSASRSVNQARGQACSVAARSAKGKRERVYILENMGRHHLRSLSQCFVIVPFFIYFLHRVYVNAGINMGQEK